MPLERTPQERPPIPTSLPKRSPRLPSTTAPASLPDRPYARTGARLYGGTPARRTITRYAFEFFQDQIETLRSLSLEEKFRGEPGSMSEMVREALDTYLAKRNRTEEE